MPPGRYLLSALACLLLTSTAFAACPDPKDLDVSVMLMNFKSPLVSAQLAELIGWDFFQVRYSGSGVFEAKKPAEVVDLDDRWSVTFKNASFDPSVDLTKRIQVKEMGVEICKSNGAISRLK
jgi:hypothetical protein